eukprot:COSAG06_NODE_64771_length_258_cov_1.415094_1_plen_31_part_01
MQTATGTFRVLRVVDVRTLWQLSHGNCNANS